MQKLYELSTEFDALLRKPDYDAHEAMHLISEISTFLSVLAKTFGAGIGESDSVQIQN